MDAHTHLDRIDATTRDAMLERARAAGVDRWVLASADPADWDQVEALGTSLGMPWTLGVHPWWEGDIEALAARETPHGIGETGLDYHRAKDPAARQRQRDSTRAHLALARERDVPVVLHCVRAGFDLISLLKQEPLPPAGGLVHSWTGPVEAAVQLVAMGLHLSFSLRVRHSRRAQESARAIPLDRLLIETDCPDVPVHGAVMGEPADLTHVAHEIAVLRDIPQSDVWSATTHNAERLFPALRNPT